MKYFILFSALVGSLQANASFKNKDWSDDMEDIHIYHSYTSKSYGYGDYVNFGIECRIHEGDSKGKVGLSFYDSGAIATPNSSVRLRVRVDKNTVYNLEGFMYSNSYRGGLVNRNIPEKLWVEMKLGSSINLEVYNHNELKTKEKLSLNGSAKAIERISSKCSTPLADDVKPIYKSTASNTLSAKNKKNISSETSVRDRFVSSEMLRYKEIYMQMIKQNLLVSPSYSSKECEISMRLSTNGLVLDASGYGDNSYCRALRAAVVKVSQFPMPHDKAIIEKLRNVDMSF
ncbi:cell envelope integrity protein TolA [Photobacterium minamisatsumaniensis]|uniref:cell envelope integrity protein TolA n=1 Tax=Photobacterium minamisatsumaniensis TaxID=2910233 RepID=UPI003D0FC224